MNLLSEMRQSLIHEPTPLYSLDKIAKKYSHPDLMVKREDKTATLYGGNKVRNLEYIFHHAKLMGAETLVTPAPMGSNFVAALAAQASKVGFNIEVHQFFPKSSDQMLSHDSFSKKIGGHFIGHQSCDYKIGAAKAYISSKLRAQLNPNYYWVAPGGSSWLGALGHFAAVGEMRKQEVPDFLVVGLGTGGTMAGLLAGIKHFGLKTKVVSVRCVDRVIANKWRVIGLANQLLRNISSSARLSICDIEILPNSDELNIYGCSNLETQVLIDEVCDLEGLQLDTTYTSKVFYKLKKMLGDGEFRQQRVLYWHTFSHNP